MTETFIPIIIGSFASILAGIALLRALQLSNLIKKQKPDLEISQLSVKHDSGNTVSTNSKIQELIWWFSGARINVLQKMPIAEHNKYATIGLTVLFTAFFASISGYYAISAINSSKSISVLFSILWGVLILNLDRYLVSSIQSYSKSGFSDLLRLMPRLILSVLIGIIVAKPLEIKLFESQINMQLQMLREEQIAIVSLAYQKQLEEYSNKVDSTQAKIRAVEYEKNKLEDQYYTEVNTGQNKGIGNRAKLFREEISSLNKEISDLRSEYQTALQMKYTVSTSLNEEIALKKNQFDQKKDTLIDKIIALESLKATNSKISLIYFLLITLLISFQSTPILIKFLSPRGPYEIFMEYMEKLEIERFSKEFTAPDSSFKSSKE
jgi:hypothetical protein